MIYQFRMYPDGTNYFPFATPALNDVYEYSPDEVARDASHTAERIHPEDLDRAYQSMLQSMNTLTDWKLDYRVNLPKKGERWLRVRSSPEKLADGSVQWNGFIFDVTEEKRLEALAKHKSKLTVIGEMSASIAHELNNPLAVISGTVHLLPNHVQDPVKFKQKLDVIEKNIGRISKLVAGLNKFSRLNPSQEYKHVRLRKVLDEVLMLTQAKAKITQTDIQISCDITGSIFCDETELEQVFVNLVNNAIDAVKSQKEKWIKIVASEDEHQIHVQLIDSGPGIPIEIQKKITEPFYTTKPAGEGTGLGLAIVKHILDAIGASMNICVVENHTCFDLSFIKIKL